MWGCADEDRLGLCDTENGVTIKPATSLAAFCGREVKRSDSKRRRSTQFTHATTELYRAAFPHSSISTGKLNITG